jgi:hypothetical protein
MKIDHSKYQEEIKMLRQILAFSGVEESIIREGITISDILKANGVTYVDFISNRRVTLARKRLGYMSISEEDFVFEVILRIHEIKKRK